MTAPVRNEPEAVLDFLVDVSELEFSEPYPIEFLSRLQNLMCCDAVSYQEIDHRARRFGVFVGIGPDNLDGNEDDDDDEVYWSVGPCPITDYRYRTGDLNAVRMSDVMGRRRYHELPIYRDYFKPAGLDHAIDIGLSSTPDLYRSFIMFRGSGDNDFTERDRNVLELLRPHLSGIEAHAALRRRLDEALVGLDHLGDDGMDASLTPREREIVDLVAQGGTNAEIAATLWIAPSTVKKHLENIYAKTGIGRRAAIASGRYATRA